MYKLSKPRFSKFHKTEVVDILKQKKSWIKFNYWVHHDTILNAGQAKEVLFLLNNPDETKRKLEEIKNKLCIS